MNPFEIVFLINPSCRGEGEKKKNNSRRHPCCVKSSNARERQTRKIARRFTAMTRIQYNFSNRREIIFALLTKGRRTWDRAKACNCSKALVSLQRCESLARTIDKLGYLLARRGPRSLSASRSGMFGCT